MSHPIRSMVKGFRLSLSQSLGREAQSLPGAESHLVSLAQAETDEFRYNLPPGWPRHSLPRRISSGLEGFDTARDWLR